MIAIGISALRDEARTRLWPLPVVALVLALAVGVVLPLLDAAVGDQLPDYLTTYLFGGGAGAARTVLSVIATSLISVTSLTFSLTVVTLQLASSQYSPRLLRTFTRDRFVHGTLALFLGSFVYALTVLRTVRTPEEGGSAFVPQLSVTVAFLLALASILGLVLFLAHLAREIRVETILRNVHADASKTIDQVLAERDPAASMSPVPPLPATGVSKLLAPASGFLVAVDPERLRSAALAADALVVIDAHVGKALVEGTPVGCAWSRTGGARLSEEDRTALQQCLEEALETGFERTTRQDVEFGLRQLTDVAVKALSPGINDPTTAVHALNHSAALLCELLSRELGAWILDDDDGRARVVVARPRFEDLLDLAVTQSRIYGADDPFVMRTLLELLLAVAWTADRPDDVETIDAQLALVRLTVDHGHLDAAHKAQLAELGGAVARVLTRPAGRPSGHA